MDDSKHTPVYVHLQGSAVQDPEGCHGCPIELAVIEALEKRTVWTDPIGKALLSIVGKKLLGDLDARVTKLEESVGLQANATQVPI